MSDDLVRSNIRIKVGDPFRRAAVDDDVRSLYATGFFYNIQVTEATATNGVILSYVVQGHPKLKEIKFQGNKKFSNAKLQKKLTSKLNEPLDEQKLFTDTQEILKRYQKAGFPRTQVKYVTSIDEAAGRGTATFEITESPKLKILRVEFLGAQAFKQKELRKLVKTRKYWMFSWLTGSGRLKDDVLEEDRERLAQFYRDHGYIDFELKDVQFENPSPRTLVVRFVLFEGVQYRVGSIAFSGNKIFDTAQITNGLRAVHALRGAKGPTGRNGLPMDVGNIFTPRGLARDTEAVEDFYGNRGYIDVSTSARNLVVTKIPNVETGNMDLEFKIEEGQKSIVEKIEIRGNTKTKDHVIRRELAISPGETFDLVRVKLSKQRLEGLRYFDRVDARPEPTDISNKKNLAITVEEGQTGTVGFGAAFSSVDSIVGYIEYTENNFDLRKLLGMEPWFQGAGQKLRLNVQIGPERQDYVISFTEPWFLDRKLRFTTDLYRRDWRFQSPEDLYDEVRTGARLSLSRALGNDFLIGSVSYTIEDVLIDVTVQDPFDRIFKVPNAIWDEEGHSLLSKLGSSLAYDTRNSTKLPNKGQRSELAGELAGLGGDHDFYSLEFRTSWYFKGLLPGHVLEISGRTATAEPYGNSETVPFYERYYLGGMYSLRGYPYRTVSPREPLVEEPIGGNTYWFGTVEYSIPIIDRVRIAVFYDIGDVQSDSYTWKFKSHTDDWGIGLRLDLPIGPLRLDYGFPIHYDEEWNSGSGEFQFGVGYRREF